MSVQTEKDSLLASVLEISPKSCIMLVVGLCSAKIFVLFDIPKVEYAKPDEV